jgi:hypothetical protein
MADQSAQQSFFAPAEPSRPKAIAIATGFDGFGAPTLDQFEARQDASPRTDLGCVLADPPVEGSAVSQHRVYMASDMRPVLGADVSAAPEVIGCNIVGRTIPGLDRGKNVDRGSDLRPGGHLVAWAFFVAPAKAGAQGCRRRLLAWVPAFAGTIRQAINGPAGSWGLRG